MRRRGEANAGMMGWRKGGRPAVWHGVAAGVAAVPKAVSNGFERHASTIRGLPLVANYADREET